MTNDYDVFVLIPALNLWSNNQYIIGGNPNYTLCINRSLVNDPNIISVEGSAVYGVLIEKFGIVVLSVETDIETDFVRHVKVLYPNKNLVVVHRQYPSTVFYIHTGGDRPNTLHNHPNSYCEIIMEKDLSPV